MSSSGVRRGTAAIISILAIVAAVLVSSPKVHAAYVCKHPDEATFPGTFNLRQDNGDRLETYLTGSSAQGQAVAVSPNGTRVNGRINGSTAGGGVTLEIYWDNGSHSVYAGDWDGNGFVHGTGWDDTRARVIKWSWDSEAPLGCRRQFAFGALAYSPADRVWGIALGNRRTQQEAVDAALQACNEQGGVHCLTEGVVRDGCVAIAVAHSTDGGPADFRVVSGATPNEALDGAISKLLPRRANSHVFDCAFKSLPAQSTRGVLYVPEITLRYDPATLFGITAFVGITSDVIDVGCTYSDGVSPARPFRVKGSEDTRINLPGIPLGITYTVTVTCDYDGGLKHTEQKVF